jgi:hypothetical protein
MKGKPKTLAHVEVTDTDMFVVFKGKRIARRGKPGTPEARTWVTIEPGYEVVDNFHQGGDSVWITEP